MTPPKLSSSEFHLEFPPQTQTVANPLAAAFLSNPERNIYLSPFLAQDMTLAVAARELGLPANKMHYWAKQMLQLGLIKLSHIQQRKGRPIQHYHSVAPVFFVPFSATPQETLEAQLIFDNTVRQRQMSIAQAKALGELPSDYGTLIYRAGAEGSRVCFQAIYGSLRKPPLFNAWLSRSYRSEDAQAIHTELQALAERYANLPQPEGSEEKTLCIHLAVVPI